MTLYVITGPPCSGKSTYARGLATPDDLVIDLDRIALAVAAEGTEHHVYPLAIRNTARLMRTAAIPAAIAHSKRHDSFIIDSKPTTRARSVYKRNGAQFVEMTAPLAVLVDRCNAERPAWVLNTLYAWWSTPEE